MRRRGYAVLLTGAMLFLGCIEGYAENNVEVNNTGEEAKGAVANEESEKMIYSTYEEAYEQVLNEYREACTLDYEDYLNNTEQYIIRYPHVNHNFLKEYLNPLHEVEGWDSPYDLDYTVYDIDDFGTPELIIGGGCHQPFYVDLITYDGIHPVRVFEADNIGGKEADGSRVSFNIFDNGLIRKNISNYELDTYQNIYYRIAWDGFSLTYQADADHSSKGYDILYLADQAGVTWERLAEDRE